MTHDHAPSRPVDAIAERYVDEYAALDPIAATYFGLPGHEDALPDLSPDGYVARADLTRRALADATAATPTDEREQVARDAFLERLGLEVEMADAHVPQSEVSVIVSGLHEVRSVFDLMGTEGEEAWTNIDARLAAVPAALDGYRETLTAGRRPGPRLGPPPAHRGRRAGAQLDRPGRRRATSSSGWSAAATWTACAAGSTGTPARPATRSPPSAAGWRRTSPRAAASATPSAGSATPSARATSSAPPSTSRRPTPGASRSSSASRTTWAGSPARSSPAAPSTTRSPPWRPTRPGRSPARRTSASGCRTSPPAPSTTWPTRTSTSPSRSAGSSAASRRPPTAASTTPAPARTSPARAACGGRSPPASRASPPGARSPRSSTRASRATTCRSRRRPTARRS